MKEKTNTHTIGPPNTTFSQIIEPRRISFVKYTSITAPKVIVIPNQTILRRNCTPPRNTSMMKNTSIRVKETSKYSVISMKNQLYVLWDKERKEISPCMTITQPK